MRAEHASTALICAVEMIVFCTSWQHLMRAARASTALIRAVEMIFFFAALGSF